MWMLPILAALAAAPAPDRMIVPRLHVGPVNGGTTREDLEKLFGAAAVEMTEVDVGEGTTEPGAVVRRGKSDAFTVLWVDSSARGVKQVRELGKDWSLPGGVHVGSSFEEVEKALGPFQMAGFQWDYAGTILLDGTKRAADKGVLWIRMEPAKQPSPRLIGDKLFPSSDPEIRGLGLTVYAIEADLAPRAEGCLVEEPFPADAAAAKAAGKAMDAGALHTLVSSIRADAFYTLAAKREGVPECAAKDEAEDVSLTFTFPKGATYEIRVQPAVEIGSRELTISGLDKKTATAAAKKFAKSDAADFGIDVTGPGKKDGDGTSWWADGINAHVAVKSKGNAVRGLYFGFAL